MKPDFGGWATRANLLCTDGRTILPGAFQHQDGVQVPLIWNHNASTPDNVLGYAVLQHRAEGVYAKAYLNGSDAAQETRELILHGDIKALSIRANRLKEINNIVEHGNINEVSVVMAGANPEALIDYINLEHGDDGDKTNGEAIIFTGFDIELSHADGEDEGGSSSEGGKTVKDVVDAMSEEQKNVLFYLVGEAANNTEGSAEHSDNDSDNLEHSQEGNNVSRNTFAAAEGNPLEGKTLSHAQRQAILDDAQKMGSLKEAILVHAEDYASYGVNNLELLFPDAKALNNTPEFIKRETEWVTGVLSGVNKVPFSRIKSLHADITHDEARARGYVRGNLKKEEFFALTKRETTPATIYKKQKLDRDDIIDVTTIDLVAWLWQEMRLMLNEEIARAILIGDGRAFDDEDKVLEPTNTLATGKGIRSIANDHEFYAYQFAMPSGMSVETMVDELVRQRRHYKGTGTPKFYTTGAFLTDMLLEKDRMGRKLYANVGELASVLRVSEIVEVEVMEQVPDLIGIFVNLKDYTVGTDRGGEISSFDDFDIDYNQYKYLLEGRMSGALTRHRTALVIKRGTGTEVTAEAPTFANNQITIPETTGVIYSIGGVTVTDVVDITEDTWVQADPASGYYLKPNSTTEWKFVYVPA